jgi:hypothetical protein
MNYTVITKSGHTVYLKEVNFDVALDDPLNDPKEKIIAIVRYEFVNDPKMKGDEFIAGLLRGLESIDG